MSVIIKTSKGDIHVQLHADLTPDTVANFLQYVKTGFYKGTIFHRVIPNFMIQGGGMTADMQPKPTEKPVANEAKVGKENKRGTIAMARTMDPHSATAQFFINVVDNAFLNFTAENAQQYGYCVFGEVVEGMDVVDAIAAMKTANKQGHGDVPVDAIEILDVVEA